MFLKLTVKELNNYKIYLNQMVDWIITLKIVH